MVQFQHKLEWNWNGINSKGIKMSWQKTLDCLEKGTIRSATKENGKWIPNVDVKKNILEAFKAGELVLMDDGTPEGERIADNWLKHYRQLKAENRIIDLPEILEVPEGKLATVLTTREYDGIFLIGAEDVRVAEAARAIVERQLSDLPETAGYKKVPLEVLLEGRGFSDQLSHVKEIGGELHFVHEILAKRVFSILFENIPNQSR